MIRGEQESWGTTHPLLLAPPRRHRRRPSLSRRGAAQSSALDSGGESGSARPRTAGVTPHPRLIAVGLSPRRGWRRWGARSRSVEPGRRRRRTAWSRERLRPKRQLRPPAHAKAATSPSGSGQSGSYAAALPRPNSGSAGAARKGGASVKALALRNTRRFRRTVALANHECL